MFFYDLYFMACVAVAFLGRKRLLRFWGNFALALIVTPVVVAVILILGSPASSKTLPQSAKTANG